MKRYLILYKLFLKTSFSALAAYRANFFINFAIDTGWVALNIILIETIFQHTASLAGWSRGEVYILFAFFQITMRLFNLTVRNNLVAIPDMVTDGTLDVIMTRPVHSLFIVSFRYLHLKALVNTIFPIALFAYAFSIIEIEVNAWSILQSIWIALMGLVSSYALLLMVETLSFWFYRFSNVYELYASVYRISRFPVDIYGKLRAIFFTIIPIALVSYLPARALFGELSLGWLVYSTFLALLFLFVAIKFWHFALRRYSSASS